MTHQKKMAHQKNPQLKNDECSRGDKKEQGQEEPLERVSVAKEAPVVKETPTGKEAQERPKAVVEVWWLWGWQEKSEKKVARQEMLEWWKEKDEGRKDETHQK